MRVGGACCHIGVNNNMHADNRDAAAHTRFCVGIALAILIATPIARAQDYYLARAIGEPVPTPTRREPAPPRNAAPDLPGLGTEQSPTTQTQPSKDSSTWKWVVGIAVTAAVVALAKGGDSGGGGSGGAPSSGSGGGDSTGGGGSGGGGPTLPKPPRLGDDD